MMKKSHYYTLRFVRGIIDSEDLSQFYQRDLQENRILANIKQGSVKKSFVRPKTN